VLPAATRTVRLDRPLDLRRTLAPVRRGGGDPCMQLDATTCRRASRTPEGPATVHLRHHGGCVEAEAWGDGATWALDHLPDLLGQHDDAAGFRPGLPMLDDLARRFAGIRFCRTNAVAEALVPTILEQKVTGTDARRSWHRLVRDLGEPAPGPGPSLRLPPSPDTLARTPSWVFHRANVERKRAHTITRAMARAHRVDEAAGMTMADAYARLLALPGVGVWSAAEVANVALGDPDAVSVGDYHLKNQISWALAGEPRGTDERMLELLEPWRGHRGRVVRLVLAAGTRAPKYGPRMPTRSFARI
jgi:3-methyladenine DNA glycosylase/8-oxoguanine DNA glycosylase